jgi:hypothetical protein
MTDLDIKKRLDPLLKKLADEKSLDVAEEIISSVMELLNQKSENRYLLNIPRIDAELSRFELAPNFARQAAAFEIPVSQPEIFDTKLFWVKKTTKTNLSWLVGITPNFEDSEANDYKSVGIDFVVPSSCDSLTILLSNRYKIRSLELRGNLTHTQNEIFSTWKNIDISGIEDQRDIKEAIHSKLWESFNFEPINRKFYLELVEHFSLLVHHLEKTFGRKPSVMFTTRLIGRILFIWFLKKKNLINQNMNYFEVSDPYKQAEYYKKSLEVLFFETLNREILERRHGDKTTPYLNGGLFDISNTDFYNDDKLTFPNGYFNQLFDTLSKYNFTVDESSPEFQQVAIDPEMLGRIFESLLSEEIDEITGTSKKKITGAFYTPREIVNYMCEQSILEYLKNKVPDSPDRDKRLEELIKLPETIFRDQDQNKRRDWKPYAETIIKALDGDGQEPLTILDPAVGSGAFPMGMLHLLTKIYGRLDSKYEKNISKLKRSILSKSLYGVDIEQTAIEICRLRAWLSIIVDIPETEEVEPLPNLDFKFVCANTLFPLDNPHQDSLFEDHELKQKLISIRNDYYKTNIKSKKIKLQNEYTNLTSNSGLFDSKKTQQLKSYHPFDIGSSADFYDPDLMSGVDKFDIVIGNPPYIDSESMVKQGLEDQRAYISTHYKLASGNWDIYIAFFERGLSLIKDGGALTFITPDTWLSKSYGQKLRKTLLPNFRKIVKLGRDVFESADLSSIVTLIEKRQIPTIKSGSFLDSGYLDINEFDKSSIGEPFNLDFVFSENIKYLSKLESIEGRIKDVAICENACSTSDCYLLKDILEEFSEDMEMKDYYRVLNSGTLDKYLDRWATKEMTYLKSRYKKPVVSREKFSTLFRNSYLTKTKLPKIMFKGLRKLDGSLDLMGDTVPGKSTLIVRSDESDTLKVVSGILNSSLIIFYLQEKYSASTYQGALTFTKDMINELPYPIEDSPYKLKILNYVDVILNTKNLEASIETQKNIDICTFLLYGFDHEQVIEYFPQLKNYTKEDFKAQLL